VKHWQETRQVLGRAVQLGHAGRACALATVTAISGSAYRRPGAKLLIEDDGGMLGGVSGGCLEQDVRLVGLDVIRGGRSRLRHYATGDDESKVWGLGLGCDGEVDVLIQPITAAAALGAWSSALTLLEGDERFALATTLEEGAAGGVLVVTEAGRVAGDDEPLLAAAAQAALRSGRAERREAGGRAAFAELLAPPPKLIVCGAGDDARPLVAAASTAGFRVVVADHRPAYLAAERFPEAWKVVAIRPEEPSAELPAGEGSLAVVMTHSLRHDTEWVRRWSATDVAYVGVLGPRARTERILEAVPAARDGRVYGPVGLDLGADGPEQVAISIVAELLSVCSRREPRHLREKELQVHAGR
jgi:xanthine/CO dehydrogenase XdhC/CoxF family maturation factor